MSRDLNHVVIIGRLVRDPEIKYTAGGVPVTRFSIASGETFVQNNEKKDHVNYFDINVWGNQAVNCEKYLKKGNQVGIIGVLRQNRWQDKTSGQTKSKVEITAFNVQFLTPLSTQDGVKSNFGADSGNNKKNFTDTNTFIEAPWEDSPSDSIIDNDPYSDSNNGSTDDIPF